MRTKTIVQGLKNSQHIRVIIQGIGFFSSIQYVAENMAYTDQCDAILNCVSKIAESKGQITGFATTDDNGYSVQVDLV
jgi:hypothetical protein